MKELVILSGKGGTGKTSLTAAFAAITNNRVLCDADVDAADLHLLMAPAVKQETDFTGGGIAEIDPDRCTSCGRCLELCRFEAIRDDFVVDPIACEGCGVCVDLCPEQAIDFPIQTCGQWYISGTRFGPMVHARLGIAEENSGKLVALVRQEARKLAEAQNLDLILTDGPPGVGCPVIASLGGATALLIVAEPTVSGIHDMGRAAELAAHFKVPAMVCVNKYDLNPDQSDAIEALCRDRGLAFVGRIPFDPVFTKAMVYGKTVFEYDAKAEVTEAVRRLWETIAASPEMNPA
ncbi:4Fe-4S binding protein [Desulfosudis oleivorans]|uniref:Cobyrinic acid ac-diamide synthase n=1 Tax=Desulfosudis oleivorans (strain DSM 6200 / JCM 39069 / Hxd3) TaxID=96561 RepID=A8ZU75_DESOH|nr:ATP-binding protein [Desulfosudis oleivorans]ABW66387.1 Cobyrinic acid ac-diamide synthase [Desulfosudis oleivorans Hxd3]